jgi:PAS domain S-box-containing protein
MFPVPPDLSIGLIGILVQLGACLLATALVVGVRREHPQREHLVWWARAWIAFSLAILVIAIRYLVVPQVAPDSVRPNQGPALWPLYLVYQTGKLLYIGFLGLGIVALTSRRSITRREGGVVIALAVAIAAGSVVGTRNLNVLVMIQAAIAAPVYGWAAWLVGRPASGLSGYGGRTLTTALVLLAMQWLLYFQGFWVALADQPLVGGYRTFLAYLTGYNSYLDAGLAVVLGIGMALTLVTEVHEETEALHATRLQTLASAQRRLADVLRAAHEGIVTLDQDRRIDLLNPAAETIFELSGAEARGQPFDRFVEEVDRESVWDDFTVTTRRSESRPAVASRLEVTGIRATGSRFPLEVSVSSLGGDSGNGYVMVLRDLTERLKEREAHERLQSQLAQAARLEAMGRMVSGVAHELNNPLTAIIAFAQDLAHSPRSDEDREALNVIIQQADRCRVIVGDLLTFARSRREERRRLAPDDLVRRVARVFERDSARYGVVLDVQVAPELPPIEVDAVGIEQVLTNLLTNAFQASAAGGRVVLAARSIEDRVEFRVEDDGAGIAAESMPRLFEPFYTTKPPGEGTGLGLAVSHTIVEQHGGTIVAENRTDGTGARFTVRLPFLDRRHEAGPPPPRDQRVSRARGHRHTALVVDVEPAIRSAIRRALERHGWTIEEAGDGEEASELIEGVGRRGGDEVGYDVLITDLRMPGISGIELVARIRQSHPTLAARTLVITGDTASPQVAEFLSGLTTPYLQKPFEMRTLVDRVERLVSLGAETG